MALLNDCVAYVLVALCLVLAVASGAAVGWCLCEGSYRMVLCLSSPVEDACDL